MRCSMGRHCAVASTVRSTGGTAVPVSYKMIIDLSHLPGLGVIETEFDSFAAVLSAREKIMAGMTIRPVLSAPAGRTEPGGNDDDSDQ